MYPPINVTIYHSLISLLINFYGVILLQIEHGFGSVYINFQRKYYQIIYNFCYWFTNMY